MLRGAHAQALFLDVGDDAGGAEHENLPLLSCRFTHSMVKGEVSIQHKLETTAEWEAHTESNAPKDWLYGECAYLPAKKGVSTALDAARTHTPSPALGRARLSVQSSKYTRRGAGRRRPSCQRSKNFTWSTWAAVSNFFW